MTNPYDQGPSNEDPFGLEDKQVYPYNSGYNQTPSPDQSPSYGGYQNSGYQNGGYSGYQNQSAGYGAQLGQAYQPGVGRTPPDNWMWATILATIICCLPLGAVGIYFSSQVESRWLRGDFAGAQSASDTARNLALASACVFAVVFIVYFVIFAGFLGLSLSDI